MQAPFNKKYTKLIARSVNKKSNTDKLISLWMSVLYSEFHWPERSFHDKKYIEVDADILSSLGFNDLIGKDIKETEFKKRIKNNIKNYSSSTIVFDPILANNINRLRERLTLSESDCMTLFLAVKIYQDEGFNTLLEECRGWTEQTLIKALSRLFDMSRAEITGSLKHKSLLRRVGLLSQHSLSLRRNSTVADQFEIMEGLAEALLNPASNVENFFERFVIESSPATLCEKDFEHIQNDYRRLTSYLKNVHKQKNISANILLYGAPGVGKTELVKTICKELDFNLYEVSMKDNEGESITGEMRFSSYLLGNRLLESNPKAVMMFDEVEDIFPQGGFFFPSVAAAGKSWINKQLEENTTPCFWLTNDIGAIDPAHVRRFDIVLEIKVPTKQKRADIIRKFTSGLSLTNKAINLIADQKHLSPAVIERSAKVAKLISGSIKEQEKHFCELICNSLKGMRLYDKKIDITKEVKPLLTYDLDLVNTDKNLKELINGLSRSKGGRLCFYGVPGTGKTELAGHIASTLQKTLLVKKASDLLNPWVGGTEKNISRMFEEAEEENSVLVLDEADSFLRNRTLANQSWEVTQVNELLTQMESFEGLFICTTNLMNDLDDASLRRFDLKLEFNYLLPEQAYKLFTRLCKQHGIKQSAYVKLKKEIQMNNNLTPGDFALLIRQYRFCEPLDVNQIANDLRKENDLKRGTGSRAIGFM